MKRYGVEYRFEGCCCVFHVLAEDWADAEARLAAIRRSGEVYGEIIAEIPANSLTLPFAALWVRLRCWWNNRRLPS